MISYGVTYIKSRPSQYVPNYLNKEKGLGKVSQTDGKTEKRLLQDLTMIVRKQELYKFPLS